MTTTLLFGMLLFLILLVEGAASFFVGYIIGYGNGAKYRQSLEEHLGKSGSTKRNSD